MKKYEFEERVFFEIIAIYFFTLLVDIGKAIEKIAFISLPRSFKEKYTTRKKKIQHFSNVDSSV